MDFRYKSSNFNRWVNNPKFIEGTAEAVSVRMERRITGGEKRFLVNFMRGLDPALLENRSLEQIREAVAEVVSNKLMQIVCEEDGVDTHELMKSQIGVASEASGVGLFGGGDIRESKDIFEESTNTIDVIRIFDQSSPLAIQKYFNPLALRRNNYILLDSRYRILTGDGVSQFSWDHVNNVTRAQGTVNTVGNIRDIVQIKVFPTRIPYAVQADNQLKRVTALFQEFSAQSFVGHENRRFHTVFDSTVDGDYINLDSYYQNEGVYRFGRPITQFNSITLSFASPLEVIQFDPDRLSSSITHGAISIITTVIPHNIASGSRVYISSFTSDNPQPDAAIINSVNTQHIVTVTSPTTFTIPVDTTGLNATIIGQIDVTAGSVNILGADTRFLRDLTPGDTLRIVDGLLNERLVTVLAIADDENLTLAEPYTGPTEFGILTWFRDNRALGLEFTSFFDSKRFVMPIELTFLTPADT